MIHSPGEIGVERLMPMRRLCVSFVILISSFIVFSPSCPGMVSPDGPVHPGTAFRSRILVRAPCSSQIPTMTRSRLYLNPCPAQRSGHSLSAYLASVDDSLMVVEMGLQCLRVWLGLGPWHSVIEAVPCAFVGTASGYVNDGIWCCCQYIR